MTPRDSFKRACEILETERKTLEKIEEKRLLEIKARQPLSSHHEAREKATDERNNQARVLLAEIAAASGHAKTIELLFPGSVKFGGGE